jgi:hypothetical protein
MLVPAWLVLSAFAILSQNGDPRGAIAIRASTDGGAPTASVTAGPPFAATPEAKAETTLGPARAGCNQQCAAWELVGTIYFYCEDLPYEWSFIGCTALNLFPWDRGCTEWIGCFYTQLDLGPGERTLAVREYCPEAGERIELVGRGATTTLISLVETYVGASKHAGSQ